MGGRGVWVLAALAVLSLSACTTPYQPSGFMGGYVDFETQPGIRYVSFRGNAMTGRETVVRYWHQRAAEICRGGYEMLSIADTGTTHVMADQGDVYTNRKPGMEGYVRCTEE